MASIQQVAGGDLEISGQLLDQGNARVSSTALQIADVGAMDIHFESELLLRQAALLSQPLQIVRKSSPNIHIGKMMAL